MPTVIEPQWLVLLFVVICLAGIAVMARIAGWSSLAVRLRAHGVPVGQSLRFVTGSLGSATFPIKYKNCLRLVLNDQGFYLALMAPFKFASPALFVPWSEVESCAVEQVYATQTVTFTFRGQWASFKLRGTAGQVAREAHQRYLVSQPALAT